MEDEVREFWEELEQEIGEKIELYTIGEYRGGDLPFTPPKVGLLYMSSTALFFQTFPKSNWFSSLMGGMGKKKKKEEEAITIRVPVEAVESAGVLKGSFLSRIFSPNMPVIRIVYDDVDEEQKEVLIATDDKGREMIKRINAYQE